jgi:hypothetical protein
MLYHLMQGGFDGSTFLRYPLHTMSPSCFRLVIISIGAQWYLKKNTGSYWRTPLSYLCANLHVVEKNVRRMWWHSAIVTFFEEWDERLKLYGCHTLDARPGDQVKFEIANPLTCIDGARPDLCTCSCCWSTCRRPGQRLRQSQLLGCWI